VYVVSKYVHINNNDSSFINFCQCYGIKLLKVEVLVF
jgi:hypothetical protein